LGRIRIQRGYYLCSHCHQGQSPRDRELDVEGTEYSPAVRRMMALVGAESSFEQGRQQLEELAGLEVTTKAVERQAEAIGQDIADREQAHLESALQLELPQIRADAIPFMYVEMDGTAIPVVKAETEGRQGKTDGEPAHTREVKLGCVFTQTELDDQSRPVRDPDSTTYTGAIETAEQFAPRIFREAWDRGWDRAKTKVVIGDGAPWIWNIADEHFPGNSERMRYAQFRAQNLFVGSGVVEAGCKTVIGRRLKMSGMFWTVRGANSIIALRCNRISRKFADYWESRAA
jgi:hypothetical protein